MSCKYRNGTIKYSFVTVTDASTTPGPPTFSGMKMCRPTNQLWCTDNYTKRYSSDPKATRMDKACFQNCTYFIRKRKQNAMSHLTIGTSPNKVFSYFYLYPLSLLKVLGKLKNETSGCPWWRSGWEPACQCRGHGFEPWSGKIPHAAEQLGPWATTTEPACHKYWSPRA